MTSRFSGSTITASEVPATPSSHRTSALIGTSVFMDSSFGARLPEDGSVGSLLSSWLAPISDPGRHDRGRASSRRRARIGLLAADRERGPSLVALPAGRYATLLPTGPQKERWPRRRDPVRARCSRGTRDERPPIAKTGGLDGDPGRLRTKVVDPGGPVLVAPGDQPGQHGPEPRPPFPGPRPARDHQSAAVDRGRIHAGVRRAAPHGGESRRPLRAALRASPRAWSCSVSARSCRPSPGRRPSSSPPGP